ncbi:uncharacterized protein EV154DRAFT_515464 [Mucor mucedo]|uniref:uncharacterized protein n=1 Tax=Mucor mucedo TaxID=29922 RepID=UPI00221F88AB|nr:uncharacterized protein EV154DRAFT_515464 [Mucor mucedo]KAI7889247.1 hypothetical protein EV154DRAFT_515464 [Mucor mucedo]
MEHKLWQYMSQKNTDWKVIAEELGVPTSYIVRHAAFIYETQLRGLHQQLRNVNTNSMSRNSAKSPAPSSKRPPSVRYSDTFQQPYDGSISPIQTPLSPQPMTRSPSQSLYQSSSSRLNTKSFSDDEEQEFSTHFQRMQVQVEEPAFLPRRSAGSTSNLTSSRQQISQSIQNLKKDTSPNIIKTSSSSSENQSAIHSSTSSFSDISESSVTQSAMEDAFILNFTHGSKTSSLGLSRKLRE